MKLTGQLGNFRTNKVMTVAEYSKQNVTFVALATPKDKAFQALAPQGKAPVLETPSGVIACSNSIVRYLASTAKTLQGENDFQKAQIDSWVDFCAQELEPAIQALVLPIFG
jgi:glutathione S-transferase